MKKFLIIIFYFICIISFTSCDKVNVKDGKGNDVEIIVDNYIISDFIINNKASWYEKEIQEANNKLMNECKYPVTYVPMKIKIEDIDGIYTRNLKVYIIGYAKNGFGVEGEVDGIYTFPLK